MATNVYTAIKKRGLKACVVYPTGIFGPNDHAISETTSTIIKIIKGEMPVALDVILRDQIQGLKENGKI